MMTADEALAMTESAGFADTAKAILAAEVRRLRDEVNGLTGSVDQASAWQEAIEDIASYMSVGVEGCDPVEAVARIKKASDDFVRVAVQRAGRAEAALKEAQEQEPSAFWWIGPDGKDNGGPYRGKPSDFAIDNARNMGCEPILLYARPVPAAPTVAVPAVPEEWREVLRECADVKAACDAEHPHRDQYPSVMRKYNNDMEIVEKARALLQSADHSERNLEKVAPDCLACANRGQVNGLSQESYCDGCVYQGRSWRKNHFVLAVKRRCEACAILPCSCK
jgi:hypothetical protein